MFVFFKRYFACRLWKDLNDNCCQNGVCNFYNNSKESCSDVVTWIHPHMLTTLVQPCRYLRWLVFCLLQVSHAFNIVYNSGLNTYALYLDCAGGVTSQRAMMHLFKNFRKHWEANKVSLIWSKNAVFQSTFIDFIHFPFDRSFDCSVSRKYSKCSRSASMHQQYCSDELA